MRRMARTSPCGGYLGSFLRVWPVSVRAVESGFALAIRDTANEIKPTLLSNARASLLY